MRTPTDKERAELLSEEQLVFATVAKLSNPPTTTRQRSSGWKNDPIWLAITDRGLVAFGLSAYEARPSYRVWTIAYEDIKAVSAHNLELKHALLPTIITVKTGTDTVAVRLGASSARRLLKEIRSNRSGLSVPLTGSEEQTAQYLRKIGLITLLLVVIAIGVWAIASGNWSDLLG